MKALIIGATGATGKDLLQVLLQDPDYTEVVAFVRRPSGLAHPKYSEVITDFENLEEVSGAIGGEVWFSCLGTTVKVAGSRERQWHIDYDIPAKFAELARRNGVSRAVVLSAYGADASSKVFYTKMKGKLDEYIGSLGFEQCLIFRPGFLVRKDTDRVGERATVYGLKLLNSLGVLRKFRPMPTSILAEKLARGPKVFSMGKHIIQLEGIFGV